jgi:hypothetical protein
LQRAAMRTLTAMRSTGRFARLTAGCGRLIEDQESGRRDAAVGPEAMYLKGEGRGDPPRETFTHSGIPEHLPKHPARPRACTAAASETGLDGHRSTLFQAPLRNPDLANQGSAVCAAHALSLS